MKRAYVKPMVVFENFSLCTNIAAGCTAIVGNPSKGSCAVTGTGGIAVFNSDIRACEFTPTDLGGIEDEWDGACYHNPGANDLFNS